MKAGVQRAQETHPNVTVSKTRGDIRTALGGEPSLVGWVLGEFTAPGKQGEGRLELGGGMRGREKRGSQDLYHRGDDVGARGPVGGELKGDNRLPV